MNITIIQDNSRVEVLGSSGASIIEKLYELAIDPNNTLTLEGNISSTSAYADQVTYLTTNYPDLIINATKLYMTFRDPHVASALLSQGVGDGTGITISDLDGITLDGNGGTGKVTFKNNTDIEYFEEFKYFTNMHGGYNGPFVGCTNLKLVSFPSDYAPSASDTFTGIRCGFVIPSLKWFLEHTGGSAVFPYTGWDNIPQEDWFDIYIGNTNNKLEDVVVTSDTVVNERRRLRNSKIKTLTWESNSNIPEDFCTKCTYLTSLTITGQNVQIERAAFFDCKALLTINGISNISRFGNQCFRGCKNASFDASQIQSNVTYIGEAAFVNVNITGSLNLPNSTSLGDSSFYNTGISSIVDLGSIAMIPSQCFRECNNLTSVVLPNSCTVLQSSAFLQCYNLSQINLSNVIEFGNLCFHRCSLLNISDSALTNATTIGSNAFNGCTNLTGSLNLPNLTSLGSGAFNGSGITSVTNLGFITTIGENTFLNCSHLDHIILPQSVTSILKMAFYNCTSLRYIMIPTSQTITFAAGLEFLNVPSSCIMYVDDNKVSEVVASNTAIGYGNFAGTIKGISDFTTDFPNG